jgi:PKD repeat protein
MLRRIIGVVTLSTSLLLTACGGGSPQPANQAPNAAFSASSTSGNAPLVVTFNADASADPDGSIVSFAWDFDGDGTVDRDSAAATATFAYTAAGPVNVGLLVTDDEGATDTATVSLTIGTPSFNNVPIATVAAPVTIGSLQAAVHNGTPAVAYTEDTSRLLYAQASNANGTAWGSPAEVQAGPVGAMRLGLASGSPAIAASTPDGTQLVFFVASNAEGSAWSAAIPVFTPASGELVVLRGLVDAGGAPGVFFTVSDSGFTTSRLFFSRGTDAKGSAWPATPVEITAAGDSPGRVSPFVLAGRPAFAFIEDGNIQLLRADNAEGSAWTGTPVQVATHEGDLDGGFTPGLDGDIPLLAFGGSGGTVVVRASNAGGTDWDAPLPLGAGIELQQLSFGNVAGLPAILGSDTDDALALFIAAAPGSSTFTERFDLFTGAVGDVTLLDAGGRPGVAYIDQRTSGSESVSFLRF